MNCGRRRFLTCLAATLVAAGCDSTASYQAAYSERIQIMEAQLKIMKRITDEETMEKALPELRKISWRFEAVKKKLEALPKLSKEAKANVDMEFAPPVEHVFNELKKEYVRIHTLPGGDVFLERTKKL